MRLARPLPLPNLAVGSALLWGLIEFAALWRSRWRARLSRSPH